MNHTWNKKCCKCKKIFLVGTMSVDDEGFLCSECRPKVITTYKLTKKTRLTLDDGRSIIIEPHNGCFKVSSEHLHNSIDFKIEGGGLLIREVLNG